MLPIAYLNGAYLPKAQCTLHASDLSILRGFGIFDYFRYSNWNPFFLAHHIDRFCESAVGMGLEMPLAKNELSEVVHQLIQRNELPDGGIRMVLTGGYAADGYTPSQPNLMAMAYAHKAPPADLYENGCKILLTTFERQIPRIKTTNYIMGILLLPSLRSSRADYPVYVDDNGIVRESDRSNVLIVQDGKLITTGSGVLSGITRYHALVLAEGLGIPCEFRNVSKEELYAADEAIICSSTKGVMPITQIITQNTPEAKPVADGQPGPITKRLMEFWTPYTLAEDRAAFLAKL